MIGFRGASRYYDERYREGFLLECRAMKRVREEMGLTNVKLMVPFCRTVDEGEKVLDVMAEAGLRRGENGLEVYVMCEIPANVILTEEFAEVFDGFSIGSNDLTQLTLGLDRDSEIVAHLFDERNPAVMKLIERRHSTRPRLRPQDRHLRPGPERLSGVRPFLLDLRHRQHFAEPRQHPSDDTRDFGPRKELSSLKRKECWKRLYHPHGDCGFTVANASQSPTERSLPHTRGRGL